MRLANVFKQRSICQVAHLRCETLCVRNVRAQLLQHREARRHIGGITDDSKLCPCHTVLARPGIKSYKSPTAVQRTQQAGGRGCWWNGEGSASSAPLFESCPAVRMKSKLQSGHSAATTEPSKPHPGVPWLRNDVRNAGVPEPPQGLRCQICGRTDVTLPGGHHRASLPAMSPSAPSVAPRRGQGVVEGAKVSAALLSAFNSLSMDSKSASPAELSEQASTSSPRALVGVRCCLVPELPQARPWLDKQKLPRGRRGFEQDGFFVCIVCDLPSPPPSASTRVPPFVCPTSRAGRQCPMLGFCSSAAPVSLLLARAARRCTAGLSTSRNSAYASV